MKVRENAANHAAEEADTEIRSGAEAQGEDIERAESEASAWSEADIREETEMKREEAGANKKDDTEAVDRAGAWAESEAKEKADIARLHYRI